ncbi:MAG TPA: hypothetical protein VMQ76_03450 [Terracidiphilus sp.]|nr:hypothetical protein [Terracidiphilus sp.]
MNFEAYLAQSREPIPKRNPAAYADVLEKSLSVHLETVRRWINGTVDAEGMLKAMRFFSTHFGTQYRPAEGKFVFRGQAKEVFDGTPRSYSYRRDVAEGFAEETATSWMPWKKGSALLVRRRVCYRCTDSKAFAMALDLAKLMKAYLSHKWADEKEVVILNTPPVGVGSQVYRLEAA